MTNTSNICAEIESEFQNTGSYIEAILRVCERCDLEIDFVAKNLSAPIIEKIRQEGVKMNFFPEISTLPI